MVHLCPSSSIFTRQIRLTRSSVLAQWGRCMASCPGSPWKPCCCFWASAQAQLPFCYITFLIALGPAGNQREQVQTAPASSGSVPNKSPARALSRAPSISSYLLCLECYRGDINTLELPMLPTCASKTPSENLAWCSEPAVAEVAAHLLQQRNMQSFVVKNVNQYDFRNNAILGLEVRAWTAGG